MTFSTLSMPSLYATSTTHAAFAQQHQPPHPGEHLALERSNGRQQRTAWNISRPHSRSAPNCRRIWPTSSPVTKGSTFQLVHHPQDVSHTGLLAPGLPLSEAPPSARGFDIEPVDSRTAPSRPRPRHTTAAVPRHGPLDGGRLFPESGVALLFPGHSPPAEVFA